MEVLSKFLIQIRRMTRFYLKYADFKVAFDYLLAECPSGLPTLDATLRTARVGVTGRESQPYIVLLNNSQLLSLIHI